MRNIRKTASAIWYKLDCLTEAQGEADPFILQGISDCLKLWSNKFSSREFTETFFKLRPQKGFLQREAPTLYEVYESIKQSGWRSEDQDSLPGFPEEQVKEYTDKFEKAFLSGEQDAKNGKLTTFCWDLTPLQIEDNQHRTRLRHQHWQDINASDPAVAEMLEATSELARLALGSSRYDTATHDWNDSQFGKRSATRLSGYGQFGDDRLTTPWMMTAAEDKMAAQTLYALDQIRTIAESNGISVSTNTFTEMAESALEWPKV